MKASMLATTLTVLFLTSLAVAEEKPANPADPTPAPSACSDLWKQLEELERKADEVCEKDDAESRKQCEALDQELGQIDEKLAGANCEDQGEEGGDDEGFEEGEEDLR